MEVSNDDKENRISFLNNGRRSKLPYAIETLLSLDNTLLCNVETDSGLHTSSEMCESFRQHDDSTQVSNRQAQGVATVALKMSPRNVSPDINEWQDKSLLNQVFAQFDSQSEETVSENCNNISNLEMFDTFCKEDAKFEPASFERNVGSTSLDKADISHQDELIDISPLQITNFGDYTLENNSCTSPSEENDKDKSPILKTKPRTLKECKIPRKKLRLSEIKSEEIKKKEKSSTEHSLFYGLTSTVKKLIQETKGICELYQWQDECLKSAISTKKNLIYALPTSGGKTLVAEILMFREIICNKKNAIFILPYVSLVQEKVQSMAILALKLGFLIEEYAGTKGRYPPIKRRRKNSIYICTIEKALGLVNSLIEMKRLAEIGIIVVDELHLLGESGGRGATLEVLLTKLMFFNGNYNDTIRLIGMSATIGNLQEIAQFLNADTYSQNFRPIEITEYVKCENDIWVVNLNSEELLADMSSKDYKYSDDVAILDPDRIGGLVMEVAPNDSCLIFCSSRKNCENVALLLTNVLPKSLCDHKVDEKITLLNALKTEEGLLCPILRKTIKFGVAYHHSGLTGEERRLLEDAFRGGVLCVICCTSTLAAGVNLPARRVILRSPYVGNQFLNLSRYKQMIGRAGRAGMGVLGESILICKKSEIDKVKELLMSRMNDSLSSLHVENDRGINNLILSAIRLNMATTRSELQKLATATLLNIQQSKINVNLKAITDETVTKLLKCGVVKLKGKGSNTGPNITVAIPSQEITKSPREGVKTVTFTKETEFQLCDLGQAAMKGPIDLKTAYILYEDLKVAQKHLILSDNLHLLYLITPYDSVSQITPIGSIYYDVIMNLTESQMRVARLLGITEATANKLRDGITPKSVEKRVTHRFYVTLIVHDLWKHHSVYFVAEKYQVNRGVVQALLSATSMFASCVVRFCQELPEFWAFTEMLGSFSKKLSYCCPLELETLMELPSVKIGRARQLYKAGYRTLQSIAKADSREIKEKIPYLSKKIVAQITAAAKLLILQKAEDLKDEFEDVLDGINVSQLELGL